MKVMRYDFSNNARRKLSKDDKISQQFVRESEEEEEEELCRSKPLLDKHNCRWNSCEFTLENKTSDTEENPSKEYIKLKDWRLHDCDKARQASKSLGNFLAFNSQQKQQYQMDTDHDDERGYDNNNKKYCKNSDSEKFVNNNKADKQKPSHYQHKRKQHQRQPIEVKANEEKKREFDLEISYKENYRRQPSNLLSCKSNTTCSKSLSKGLFPNNNNNNQKRIARIAVNRARRRRGILSSSALKAPEIITPANLSLSSPVLVSHHDVDCDEYDKEHKQQQPTSRPQDAIIASTVDDQTKPADPNNSPSSITTFQCPSLSGGNNNDSFMEQLDDGQLVVAEFNDVHACETKRETFIIKDNRNGHATGETNRLHCCFVDVASSFEISQAYSNNKKIDQQQQQQQAQQSQLSSWLQGCSTNERSSCCNNSNSNANSNALAARNDGKLSSVCLNCDASYYIEYDNDKSNTTSALKPIEVNGSVKQGNGQKRNTLQSQVTDNEEEQVSFDGRGVGVGNDGKLSFALDNDADCEGQNELDFSTSIKPLSCLSSESTRPIVDSLLNILDKQQKETLFHYQPRQCPLREEEIEVERNFNSTNKCLQHHQITNNIKTNTKQNITIEKLENFNDLTKNTTNATPTTNSNKLMLVDLNNFPAKFMNYNSWPKVLLQPGNSATYKVVKQQEVSTVSGSPTTFTALIEENKRIIPHKKQETCEQTINHQYQGKNNNVNNKTVARYSRPGRSPISLQRQTNARLTRHKLKIQQQRQEQLAHLALKERKQFSQQNSNNNSYSYRNYHNLVQHSSRSEGINFDQSVSRETGRKRTELLCLSQRGFNRNNYHKSPSIANTTLNLSNAINIQQYITRSKQLNQPDICPQTLSRLYHQPVQVHTPPIASSIAIEISDDQLACSSRQQQQQQQQQQQTVNSKCNSQKVSTSTGNVIVYNSFNMLRSGSSDLSLGGQQQNQFSSSGGGGGGGSKRSSSHSNHSSNNNNDNSNRGNKRTESEDTQTICSSTGSTISLNRPFCKICHVSSTKNGDKLISPCKCSGTMQYIHCGCLLKWLEISNRTNEKPMSCELCAHEYTWHKKFNYREAKLPRCSFKDIICHSIFLAAIGIMLLSALAPIMHRKSNDQQDATFKKLTTLAAGTTELSSSHANYKTNTNNNNLIDEQQPSRRYHMPSSSSSSSTFHYNSHSGQSNHLAATSRLANDEKYILLCAASFFISFFLAIYVETKARDTLYGLFIKFLAMNQTYYITEYDHGQLNSNTNSNSIANGNSNNVNINNSGSTNNSSDSGSAVGGISTNTKLEQQQQQRHHNTNINNHCHQQQQNQQNYRPQPNQQYNGEESRFDRKNSENT